MTLNLLNEGVARLALDRKLLSAGGWFACFAFYPLPHLHGLRVVVEDDDVFACRLRNLRVDLPARGVFGKLGVGGRNALEDSHAPLRNGLERVGHAVNRNTRVSSDEVVPHQFLSEQASEVEGFQPLLNSLTFASIAGVYSPRRKSERTDDLRLLRLGFLLDSAEAILLPERNHEIRELLVGDP